jgi:hypothetical protein
MSTRSLNSSSGDVNVISLRGQSALWMATVAVGIVAGDAAVCELFGNRREGQWLSID